MVGNKKGKRGKSSGLFSDLPGDPGGYLETLREGRVQKREALAVSRGTSRLHRPGCKCKQDAGQLRVRGDLEAGAEGRFPRAQS